MTQAQHAAVWPGGSLTDLRERLARWYGQDGDAHGAVDVDELVDATADQGVLRLLTYNVAGLPDWISQSKPSTFLPLISPLLNHYHVALVQEDFSYHEALAHRALHPFRSEPSSPRYLMNDGLNRFSTHPFSRVERVRWNDCHGFLDHASDCLADKGFSRATTTLAKGVEVDIYNLHAEAGRGAGDFAARRRGFTQLADHIERHSRGRAVVVAGDLNLHTSAPEDETTLRRFLERTGLTDVCRSLQCGDERIDRVLMRSSTDVQLRPLSWSVDRRFVNREGRDLSDHEAVGVELVWQRLGAPPTADPAPPVRASL